MKAEQKEKISKKFQDLIVEGYEILQRNGWDGKRYYSHPNDIDYKRFRAEALNIVRRVCGEKSDHYLELRRLAEDSSSSNNSYYYKDCIGIVEAARKDFEHGFLFDLRSLVLAELLGDFIDQSKSLLQQGYVVAAASLAGAVLEDSLRKLCNNNGIHVPEKTKIDRLNADLARADVYSVGVQKRITALADIRNNADHGKFDLVKKEEVEDMVSWISRFTIDHLE